MIIIKKDNSIIQLIGGNLYQWDTGRRIKIKNGFTVNQIDFSNQEDKNSITSDINEIDGIITSEIPPKVLQKSGNICVYAVLFDDFGERTIIDCTLPVYARHKPDDYDANIMFGDMFNEICDENIKGGLGGKLNYLKECIDILYQQPEIKLMREIYGENRTLKELCELISEHEQFIYKNITGLNFTYSNKNGFESINYLITYPNGNTDYDRGSCFIAPITYLQPINTNVISNPNSISNLYIIKSDMVSGRNIQLVDFRNIKFLANNFDELKKFPAYGFKVSCFKLYGIYLPKKSLLNSYTLTFTGNNFIEYGLHLGKYVSQCYSNWLFGDLNIDPSSQRITPVYCDKDFFGTVYLEKLNIPLECIFGIIENAMYKPDDMQTPTLSIGDYNINKINTYLNTLDETTKKEFENLVNNLYEKFENKEITREQLVDCIKNFDYTLGTFFEFIELKGWKLI